MLFPLLNTWLGGGIRRVRPGVCKKDEIFRVFVNGDALVWSSIMRRDLCCTLFLLTGGLLASVEAGRASGSSVPERTISELGGTAEEWLGEGNDLRFELEHVIVAGKKGNLAEARRDLERIAATAEKRGSRRTWLEAEKWWVKFTFQDDPAADFSPVMESLVERVRDWSMPGEEIGLFAMWADLLRDGGQWMMAVKAQDRATQLALDLGRVPRALEAFLEMARLCRQAGHSWRQIGRAHV